MREIKAVECMQVSGGCGPVVGGGCGPVVVCPPSGGNVGCGAIAGAVSNLVGAVIGTVGVAISAVGVAITGVGAAIGSISNIWGGICRPPVRPCR